MLKKALFAGVAAMALSMGSAAQAVPTLQYQILDGGLVIGSGSTTSGTIALSGSDSRFMMAGGFASSAPNLAVPNFSSSVFTVTANGAASAATLTIRISATDLSGYAGGNLMNTFTLNSLNGGPFTSGTISTYFDNANTAYGTGTLLATDTFTGLSSFNSMTTTSATPSALFSETAIYTLNFAAGQSGTVSASAQLNSVPEPASMALLGMGLVGAGLLRRRSSPKA